MKGQKNLEPISLRISVVVLIFHYHFVGCMIVYVFYRKLQSNQHMYIFLLIIQIGFFLMNNMMILMLLTVHGDIVQQIATKLNE